MGLLGLPVQTSSERCDPSYGRAQLDATSMESGQVCAGWTTGVQAGATWRCMQLHAAATHQRWYRARYATPSLFKQLKVWSTGAKEQKAEGERSLNAR